MNVTTSLLVACIFARSQSSGGFGTEGERGMWDELSALHLCASTLSSCISTLLVWTLLCVPPPPSDTRCSHPPSAILTRDQALVGRAPVSVGPTVPEGEWVTRARTNPRGQASTTGGGGGSGPRSKGSGRGKGRFGGWANFFKFKKWGRGRGFRRARGRGRGG